MSAEADDTTKTSTDVDVNSSKEKYSEEEIKKIRELREEAKSHRLKNKEILTEFELYRLKNEDALKSLNEEKEKLKADVEKYSTYEKRLIETEVKAQSVIEGIKDVDLIKLIDMSTIKISESGEVDASAISEAVKSLKEKKPFLFGTERLSSTSSNASISKKTTTGAFDALTVPREEFEKQWRSLKNMK